MTDIIERLRGHAQGLQVWIDDGMGAEFGYSHKGLMKEQAFLNEAADEIERLRKIEEAARKVIGTVWPHEVMGELEEALK